MDNNELALFEVRILKSGPAKTGPAGPLATALQCNELHLAENTVKQSHLSGFNIN